MDTQNRNHKVTRLRYYPGYWCQIPVQTLNNEMPHQCQELVLQDVPWERNMEKDLTKRKKKMKKYAVFETGFIWLFIYVLSLYICKPYIFLFTISTSNPVIVTG